MADMAYAQSARLLNPSGQSSQLALAEYFICNGAWGCNHGYTDTHGRVIRNLSVNTGVRNLVLIIAGQSLMGAEAPTSYVPTHANAVDQVNIYDGAVYAMADPPLGSTWTGTSVPGHGAGSIGGRIADLFLTAGTFDRVILVPIAVGASSAAQWGSGILSNRICAALARLPARGLVPQSNVTVAILWGQGETDNLFATPQATYTASLNSVVMQAQQCGFSGRFFVNVETWFNGAISAPVQAAQIAAVNNTTVFAGGNLDTLGLTNRVSDNTHLNDVGMANAAVLIHTAMHASGAPF